MPKPFLRYPGGKSKHVGKILRYIREQELEYREPFIGGGSVFLGGDFPNAWINDIDSGVYDVWRLVKEDPNVLIDLIEEHTTILDHKYDPKKIEKAIQFWKKIRDDVDHKFVPSGFRFLFLSRTCFSGVVTGGPVGGTKQKSQYTLLARWSKNSTIRKIRESHQKLQGCKITKLSWEAVVQEPGNDTILYLDPPYLHKGKQCYEWHFTEEDHEKLAKLIVGSPHRYVVTVDDCPEVRKIWMDLGVPPERLHSEEWLYSMNDKRTKNRVGKELFVMDELSFRKFESRLL